VIAASTQTAQPFPLFPAPPLPSADPPSGTHVYLLQNSRLGLAAFVTAQQPGFPSANQKNALGLQATVRQTHVGSRCSGKERDQESGLDYFGARYLSGPEGRFTSADPGSFSLAHVVNPQKWNRYAYVLNNPFVFVDITGAAEQRIINVYLGFRDKDRSTLDNVPLPWSDWSKVATRPGFSVQVHQLGSYNAGDVARSAATADVTAVAQHGFSTREAGKFVSQFLQFGDNSQINMFGVVDSDFTTHPGPVPVSGILVLFTCNSVDQLPSLFKLGAGAVLVLNTGGPDGVTRSGILEAALYAFVNAYVASGGDVNTAMRAAQHVVDSSAKGGDGKEPDPMQAGDKVIRVPASNIQ
jgi:RHS repeat-associated protein